MHGFAIYPKSTLKSKTTNAHLQALVVFDIIDPYRNETTKNVWVCANFSIPLQLNTTSPTLSAEWLCAILMLFSVGYYSKEMFRNLPVEERTHRIMVTLTVFSGRFPVLWV